MKLRLNLFILFCIVFYSCYEPDFPDSYEPALSPYDAYKESLIQAHLDSTLLGRLWIDAGNQALRDSLHRFTPFREVGFFKSDEPSAAGIRLNPRTGEVLEISVEIEPENEFKVFLEVFEELEKEGLKLYKRVISADSALDLSYIVENSRPHIVRLQPELLASCKYILTIFSKPSLAFPVAEKDTRAVGSVFGDPRDGGIRKHKGIDIFAKRGTPAIAAAEAVVSRVGSNRLGGKVVWLRDHNKRQYYYYAHLDSQMVYRGQKVFPGDTIGLIGNTGNARWTPPHLHFSVYKFGRGAVDPYWHVHAYESTPEQITFGDSLLGTWVKIKRTDTELKIAHAPASNTLQILELNMPLYIQGFVGSWLRIKTPNEISGFIHGSAIHSEKQQVSIARLDTTLFITKSPSARSSPIASIGKGIPLDVIAEYQNYLLVESPDGKMGWITND